jgi:hypothetical protein
MRAQLRPMIQNLGTNLHRKLESYPDSRCPELNLAHMPPTPPHHALRAREEGRDRILV